MGEFEELKRRIMIKIDGEEEIPKEVMNIIMRIFEQIEEIYNEYGCNNSSISERIYVESEAMKKMLYGRIATDMKNKKFQMAMDVMNNMKRYIEEFQEEKQQILDEESQDKDKRMRNDIREGLSEIGGDNRQIVSTIMREMEYILNDIRLSQNRILSYRGELNTDEIYEIQQKVLDAIRQFEYKDEEILQLLQEKDERLRNEILEQYKEYAQHEEKSKNEKNEAEAFRDSLNVGISLEEQAHLAKIFMDEQKQEEQDSEKPKLLADELPDLFL